MGKRIAVIGASGGIGAAFVRVLGANAETEQIYALSRRALASDYSDISPYKSKVSRLGIDITDEQAIASAAAACSAEGPLDMVLVTTGILHRGEKIQPEKALSALNSEAMLLNFHINSVGPALVMKHFLPVLHRDRRVVFAALSARVGSISDNRLGGWYSYRASKAALNMLIRTASIEYKRLNAKGILLGLHPGTVDTGLSAPFQKNVPQGKLFTPDHSAQSLLGTLLSLTAADSGACFSYDGEIIPE